MEEIEDDGALAAITPATLYVLSPQERRSSMLYTAIQSFGQDGADLMDDVIERAEVFLNYIENGRAA